MVTVRINEIERDYSEINNGWIASQITNREKENIKICVVITIKTDRIGLVLLTKACPRDGYGAKTLNEEEREIYERWEDCELNDDEFDLQNLIKFIKSIKIYQ